MNYLYNLIISNCNGVSKVDSGYKTSTEELKKLFLIEVHTKYAYQSKKPLCPVSRAVPFQIPSVMHILGFPTPLVIRHTASGNSLSEETIFKFPLNTASLLP